MSVVKLNSLAVGIGNSLGPKSGVQYVQVTFDRHVSKYIFLGRTVFGSFLGDYQGFRHQVASFFGKAVRLFLAEL